MTSSKETRDTTAQQGGPLIPGNEIVGVGVNVVGAVYSTTSIPVGGLKNRVFSLGSADDGQQWTFAPTGTVYTIPPGLETPSGGNTSASIRVGMTRSDFSETFSVSASVSGSYGGFSAQLDATYDSNYQNDQEYSYAYVVQDGLTWSIRLNTSTATLTSGFVDAVNGLPDVFDRQDPDKATPFYEFFDVWGTHYVVQAGVGGRLYYYAVTEKSYGMSASAISASLSAEWRGLIASVEASSQAAWQEVSETWSESRDTFLVSVGPGSQEIDVESFLSPSRDTWLNATTNIVTQWQQSVNQGPGAVSTLLLDITSAVGHVDGVSQAKIRQIQLARAVYGEKHIHVTTETNNDYNAGADTTIIIDGAGVSFENAPSANAICGLVAVVIDRSTLATYLAKFYEPSEVSNNYILNWEFQEEFRRDVTNATTQHPSFIIIVATYGLDALQACPANGNQRFGEKMQSWGAGAGLAAWSDLGPSGYASPPSGDSPLFGYILIGANDLDPGAGVEAYLDGGIVDNQSYIAKADAQLQPGQSDDGTTMIFTPVPR